MRPAPEVPCEHCPVGAGCPAISKRIGRYCEILDPAEPDHRPGHAADMAAILRGEPHPHYARTGSTPPAAPTPPPTIPAEQARLSILVNKCLDREPIRCGCADRRAVCKLEPERPVERTHDECVACVRRRSPA